MPSKRHPKFLCLTFSFVINLVLAGNEVWPDGLDRPAEMPIVTSFDVTCGKDHMDIQIRFSGPFNGIVSSKGQYSDPNCIYVPPSSGKTFYAIRVPYARCGTKPDLNGQFYENTVVIQYDKDLVEAWDEPKRLRCEWYNEYEKTASKPPMLIADLDVIQLDFRGDNVDCWMEIQNGKGPWSQPVSGIVPIGSTLTLVVAINDYRGEFDMRVKSCAASDGTGHTIDLSDEFGCVLRPKMISRFIKARAPNDKATVITYAFFHAFKFPDALSVQIKCKVEICRHGCMDHCQMVASNKRHDVVEQKMVAIEQPAISRLDSVRTHELNESSNAIDDADNDNDYDDGDDDNKETSFYEEFAGVIGLKTEGGAEDVKKIANEKPKSQLQLEQKPSLQLIHPKPGQSPAQIQIHKMSHESSFQQQNILPAPVREDNIDDIPPQDLPMQGMLRQTYIDAKKAIGEKFPHGPRSLGIERIGLLAPPPLPTRPRSLNLGEKIRRPFRGQRFMVVNRRRRHRRSVIVSDNQSYSADIGVVGVFDVVSEADLAFSPSDDKSEAETVLQGKIEEFADGICMPMPLFSLLSILVGFATIALALITGSLWYRYQSQKDTFEKQTNNSGIDPNSLTSWITLRLFRMNDNDMHPSAAMADISSDPLT